MKKLFAAGSKRSFRLYLRGKKSYNFGVQICPRCNTTIHAGAESQCPACGYSLLRANALFGEGGVRFTRVLDEAGVLTHSERQELMRALEDMERNLPPIALCGYITNNGRAQDLRPQAHWMLNHAVVHHPSFGRREKARAIEDAELTERTPGEKPELLALVSPPSRWQRLRARLRDVLHPYPPPVRREWMLLLVLDVQLEMACFAWGYMLDPYINPDRINSCIVSARLQFRERDMVAGMRRVMRAAVNRIAAQSHSVNRRLRRTGATLALGAALLAPGITAPVHAEPEWAEAAAPQAASAPAAVQSAKGGRAAGATVAPLWNDADYGHLLSGELNAGYKMLQAPQAEPRRAAEAPAPKGSPARGRTQESDTKISKVYYPQYSVADKGGVIDPQRLLSEVERADVEHSLSELNAHSPYRLYIGIYRAGQELPMELAVGSLVRSVARPGEYAAMVLYGIGDSPEVELGYYEMELADADRHAWLARVRRAAEARGGVEGLMAAARELHACLLPVAAELPPLAQQSAVHVPLIPLEMREKAEEKEPSMRDKLFEWFKDPRMQEGAMGVGAGAGVGTLLLLFIWLRRRSGRLCPTQPDVRLASPHGAGVSRAVRYLEGKEAPRSSRG